MSKADVYIGMIMPGTSRKAFLGVASVLGCGAAYHNNGVAR